MLLRFVRRLTFPAVMRGADQLVERHGPAAVVLAKHGTGTAQGRSATDHLHRVLAKVERRMGR